jgi:hypothetical protein
VKFLLFGNDGFTLDAQNKLIAPADSALVIRKPLQAFIPDARHAVMAAVLVGNASLDTLAEGSNAVQDVLEGRTFENATVTVTGTPTFLTDINDYLQGGMLVLGSSRLDDGRLLVVQGPLAAAAAGRDGGRHRLGLERSVHRHQVVARHDRRTADPVGLGIELRSDPNRRGEPASNNPQSLRGDAAHMGPPLVAATIAAVIAFLTVKISGPNGAGLRCALVDRDHRPLGRRGGADHVDRRGTALTDDQGAGRVGWRPPSIDSAACPGLLCCRW